jgi:hypothetical protein
MSTKTALASPFCVITTGLRLSVTYFIISAAFVFIYEMGFISAGKKFDPGFLPQTNTNQHELAVRKYFLSFEISET